MKTLYIYSKPKKGFSGQAAATELIVEGLSDRGYSKVKLLTPALDRTASKISLLVYLSYLLSLTKCFLSAVVLRFSNLVAVHVTLGQTPVAMLRDGICLFLSTLGRRPSSFVCVVALNGSLFSEWHHGCLEARLFRWIIKRCNYVTCLGVKHKEILVELGIPRGKVAILPNVSEYSGAKAKFVQTKHELGDRVIRILFLSSLIDTKGFPEYLEAIHSLSPPEGFKIHATLCGPITITPYSERFKSFDEAQQWVNKKISLINESPSVHLERIEQAKGIEKQALFEQAHIFVLPSRYKVEAQPLVVIEAMAFGCAVVTSTVGELPSTVDDKSAIILENPNTLNVTQAITALCNDHELRAKIALGGLSRFTRDFNRERYLERWEYLMFKRQILD